MARLLRDPLCLHGRRAQGYHRGTWMDSHGLLLLVVRRQILNDLNMLGLVGLRRFYLNALVLELLFNDRLSRDEFNARLEGRVFDGTQVRAADARHKRILDRTWGLLIFSCWRRGVSTRLVDRELPVLVHDLSLHKALHDSVLDTDLRACMEELRLSRLIQVNGSFPKSSLDSVDDAGMRLDGRHVLFLRYLCLSVDFHNLKMLCFACRGVYLDLGLYMCLSVVVLDGLRGFVYQERGRHVELYARRLKRFPGIGSLHALRRHL